MVLVRRIARPMLASLFISSGINALRNSDYLTARAAPVADRLAPLVSRVTAPMSVTLDTKQMVQLNGGVQLVAGGMLATGRMPRLSALALGVTLLPTTLARHRFWEETDPQQRADQQVHFLKNLSMLGGLLLASVDTEGKPSVAWLARHSAKQVTASAAKQANKLTSG